MKTRTIATAAAAIATTCGLASAGVVTVQYTGTGQGRTVHVASPEFNGNVFAGQLKHTISGGLGDDAEYNGNHLTFCTDLSQRVTSTPRTYEIVGLDDMPNSTPMGGAKADAIRKMYDFAGGSQLLGTTSTDLGAAFQLAVWEIITDYNPSIFGGNLSVTSGSFRATKTDGSSLWTGVQTQLAALLGAATTEGNGSTHLAGIRSTGYQDQIVPIPAPGSAVLAGLGLVCLTGRRRNTVR
ncbi:MAG: PEP-CTERM sorting domain-containing protein [Leptolyngbya sp. PLA1]|nr:PEP-CTERM sorting domain-containing protein [Leptolyngbya sp. PLA1]